MNALRSALNALRDGSRRVNDAPAILFGMWLLLLAVNILLRGGLRELIVATPGAGPRPLATPFGPLDVLDAVRFALWLFFSGGIMDRYARDRPTRSEGFFAASGVFFFRFLRLGIVMGAINAALVWMRPEPLVGSLVLYTFVVAFTATRLIAEYAAVRSVIEDRRSMINSLSAALRFIVANIGAVVTVNVATRMLSTLVVVIFITTAPALDGIGVGMWSGFVVGQLFALAQIWVALVGWAAEVSMFQSKLAHAGYVARTQPAWPESPAAEAITASARSRSSG